MKYHYIHSVDNKFDNKDERKWTDFLKALLPNSHKENASLEQVYHKETESNITNFPKGRHQNQIVSLVNSSKY